MRFVKQGVNQTVILNLSFDPGELVEIEVIFQQQGNPVVTKRLAECVLTNDAIHVALTQYDTLKLSPQRFSVTLRGKYSDGGTVVADDIPFVVCRSSVQGAI